MTAADLPAVNASLNATSALLLSAGYVCIRRQAVQLHRLCMVSAFVCSIAFLACYLAYHLQAGVKYFPGSGLMRSIYLSILGTHTLLAATVPILAVTTLLHALRGRFDRHRALAKWTWPIWMYVSVTGVIVYWMLYRMPN